MSYPTFSPPRAPDRGISLDSKITTLSNDFGDGYEQALADGLNPITDTLTLKWTGLSTANKAAIIAFFRGQLAAPFLYVVPGDSSASLWRCKEFSTENNGETHDVSATFEVVFIP